jgi:hypothetical protein
VRAVISRTKVTTHPLQRKAARKAPTVFAQSCSATDLEKRRFAPPSLAGYVILGLHNLIKSWSDPDFPDFLLKPQWNNSGQTTISQSGLMMKHVGQRYVQYINRNYVLGGSRFSAEIEAMLRRRVTPGKAGRLAED